MQEGAGTSNEFLEAVPLSDSIIASENSMPKKKLNWDMVEFIAQKIPFYYPIWEVLSSYLKKNLFSSF